MNRFGIVVIGRNEGARLVRCLESIRGATGLVVYVDSASTDGSCAAAAARGAAIENLSADLPFTAARARNSGLRRLRSLAPQADFVHFVDGDCEVVPGWIEQAIEFLAAHPDYAAVCGRRRERHPLSSVYNRLTDIEWDTPIGDATDTGGDALYRIEALDRAGGFRDDLIAGEEPELGLRLRRLGYRIRRMDRDMTIHDVGMTGFSQWWKRQVRAGHACAEAVWLHGRGPERFFVRRLLSVLAWGMCVPLLGTAGAFVSVAPPLLALAALTLFVVRVWFRARRGPLPGPYAASILLGKFAECQGVLLFARNRLLRRRTQLIEPREATH